ncbi:MAG: 2,5-diketo-D-gluconate reductase [Mycobacterium sp.]|jgi:diketogulonate reductase-like aldo/keto reductase|nr:2,5-diketo-D-gluconate reductase [Mycobacterium sp.]
MPGDNSHEEKVMKDDFVSTWIVLDEFARDGRARSIGVSNFQPDHLNRLAKESCVIPVGWQQGAMRPCPK